jgi:hypothetical protein
MAKTKERFTELVAKTAQGKDQPEKVLEGSFLIGYGEGVIQKGINDLLFENDGNATKNIWYGLCQIVHGVELIAQQHGKTIYDVIQIEREKMEDDVPREVKS